MADPKQIIRPNGKPYRPRKPPSVELAEDSGGDTVVMVLRTHDTDLARRMAARFIAEYDLNADDCYLAWQRLVPWDAGSGCDTSWISDGTHGMPAVIWETT